MDPRRRKSLESLLLEFWELMKAAIEPSLFESSNPIHVEARLVEAETHLSAAEGCVNAMRRIWPDGDDVYTRFSLAVSELTQRRRLAERFMELMSREISMDKLRAESREIIAKNRETLMIAGTYVGEGAEYLLEQTGIELRLE